MERTIQIINDACLKNEKSCLAFSGGSDSLVLLDIVYTKTAHRPLVVYCDDQMSHQGTTEFVQATCNKYKAPLIIARGKRTPLEQWRTFGWPMLGKMSARIWMQKHKHRDMGYRLDVSSCCRKMKIEPARQACKQAGMTLQITGQRGASDDRLRALRTIKDQEYFWHKSDKINICNPLTGWTDIMIERYHAQHGLKKHPAIYQGAQTIGCIYCGGGAQFTNSGIRILRKIDPVKWRKFIVDNGAGEIILSIKYDVPLSEMMGVINIAELADAKPWIFDYLRSTPMPGYDKGMARIT